MRRKSRTGDVMGLVNGQLAQMGASLRVVSYSLGTAALSTGGTLNHREFVLLRRRIVSHAIGPVIDEVYSSDPEMSRAVLLRLKREAGQRGAATNLARNRAELVARATANCLKALNEGRAGWRKGMTPWNAGLTKANSEVYRRMSTARTGAGNPMFGTSPSPEQRAAKSTAIREKIANGTFTPNVLNRLTSRSIQWCGRRYRSSWEVVFAATHPWCEYETLRVRYEWHGRNAVYLVDFIDRASRVAYEIKPRNLTAEGRSAAKIAALSRWCAENDHALVLLDEDFIGPLVGMVDLDHPDFAGLTSHMRYGLRRLHETRPSN